jgi:geranylgeranyl diphosphate synthase type I
MTTASVRTAGRDAAGLLAWSRSMVDPALRAAIDTLPGSMRRISGYHFGWWDADGHATVTEGGKALRPALTLLCAQLAGGDPAVAVPAAVAVELVHNFSLLHDDVMDKDTTRRHRPTAWSVYGVGAAILAGDALLNVAFQVLADTGPPFGRDGVRMLSDAVAALIEGQATDLSFEQRADVTVAECTRMAEGKTGALFGCACALGGLFGGGSEQQVRHQQDFGIALGLAFQHVDDLLGIWGDPSVTGKPARSDLASRKKSFPVVAALTTDNPVATELIRRYRDDRPLTASELTEVAQLVELAGGRAWTRQRAEDLFNDCLRELRAAAATAPSDGAVANSAVEELMSLAKMAARRVH